MHISTRENIIAPVSVYKKVKIIFIYFIIFWIALPVFLFTTGIRINELFPQTAIDAKSLELAGVIFSAFGALIILTAIFQIWRSGKGLPISHLPPRRFVDSGLYKIVRHPIYVGYNLLFVGISLILNLPWTAIFSGFLLLAGWIAYAIYFEEPELLNRFGEIYRSYQKNVPLLFPQIIVTPLQKPWEKIKNTTLSALDALANKTLLFNIGRALFVTYGVFISVGALLFMIHSSALLVKQNISLNDAAALIGGSTILGIFFGRLFWYLGHWLELKNEPRFGIRKVGYVSFGDLTGIIAFAFVYSSFKGINFFKVSDAYAAGMFLAYSIGRIGCLTYGCCYGRECESSGILYRDANSKVVREKGTQKNYRYPSQIYSSIHGFLLFIFLNLFMNLNLPAGMTTAMGLILYAVGRTYIEFYRDRKRIVKNVLTEGHIGCAVIFLSGTLILFLIDPNAGTSSDRMWNWEILSRSLSIFPIQIALAFIVFIVASFHWRKVGTW